MEKRMKTGIITTFAVLVYIIVCIIATAGAVNHGFKAHEYIFGVAGALNLIFAGLACWKIWKTKINK